MTEDDTAIRFDGITKSFGDRTILDDISFEVVRGKAFCLLGRSGSGKSLTLKHMIGLIAPDSGEIYVEGAPITNLHGAELARVRKRMGFLFQYSALFDSITVGGKRGLSPALAHRTVVTRDPKSGH